MMARGQVKGMWILRLTTYMARRRSGDVSKMASEMLPIQKALKVELNRRCCGIEHAPEKWTSI